MLSVSIRSDRARPMPWLHGTVDNDVKKKRALCILLFNWLKLVLSRHKPSTVVLAGRPEYPSQGPVKYKRTEISFAGKHSYNCSSLFRRMPSSLRQVSDKRAEAQAHPT